MTYYGEATFTDDTDRQTEVQAVLSWTHSPTGLRDLVGALYWAGSGPLNQEGTLQWPQGHAHVYLEADFSSSVRNRAKVVFLGDAV